MLPSCSWGRFPSVQTWWYKGGGGGSFFIICRELSRDSTRDTANKHSLELCATIVHVFLDGWSLWSVSVLFMAVQVLSNWWPGDGQTSYAWQRGLLGVWIPRISAHQWVTSGSLVDTKESKRRKQKESKTMYDGFCELKTDSEVQQRKKALPNLVDKSNNCLCI